jgi:hypothetical protein
VLLIQAIIVTNLQFNNMGATLEISGAYKRTEKGNTDWYYGGGLEAWTDMSSALSGVPASIRPGKTIGINESGRVVEYIWPISGDVTGAPIKKTAEIGDSGADAIRGTFLNGLSTVSSAAITAGDTILGAFGKLQKQISNLVSTAQIITGKFTFKGFINLFPGIAPTTPSNGDVWMETANNRFRAYKGTQSVDLLTSADNFGLVGSGSRLLVANTYGDISASETIVEGEITDSDLIAAIVGAAYNSGNKFIATISVTNKNVYAMDVYLDASSGYFYIAVADNKIMRLQGS